MKIAFGKFNLGINIDMMSAKNPRLGTDVRVGILKALYDLGHEITIYTKLAPIEERFRMVRTFDRDKVWVQKLGYKPESMIDKDSDVFLLECAPTNTVYQYKTSTGEEKSYIVRSMELAQDFEGRIVYWQHSPVLTMPFGDAFNPPNIDEVSPLNIRRIISSTGLFDKADWRVLLNVRNIDEYIEMAGCRGRCTYKTFEDRLEFEYIPITYSPSDPRLPVKEKPTWDLTMVGGENISAKKGAGGRNSRFEGVKKFYDHAEFKSRLIGRWPDETAVNFEHLDYQGVKGNAYDALLYLQDSYICIWVKSEFGNRVGFASSRIPQTIRSGCTLLVDEDINVKDDYLDEEFWISDHRDIRRWLKELKGMTLEERIELNEIQHKKLVKWQDLDWNYLLRR